MSVLEIRGGIPKVFREAITHTAGYHHTFPFTTKYIQIRVLTNACKMYFSQADFDGDVDYVLVPIPAAETPYGEWRGIVEAKEIWLKGVTGSSTVELVAYQRRG